MTFQRLLQMRLRLAETEAAARSVAWSAKRLAGDSPLGSALKGGEQMKIPSFDLE